MSADDWSIVDAHQHFQDLEGAVYPWLAPGRPEPLEGDLSPIRRTYLVADYRRDAEGFGVVKTVHVQNGRNPVDPLDETRWLESLAERSGLPDAIVAAADLADPDAARLLEAHAAFPHVRGIRQILNWHEEPRLRSVSDPALMENPSWRAGFARLAPLGLSFDLQIYWPQMDMALALARAFPDTAIVLDHFGMPIDASPEGLGAWRAALLRLAAAPNVMVKLSGFGLGRPAWTTDILRPLLHHALDCFGPHRAMVGTNLPVDRLFAPPGRLFEAIRESVIDLSAEERAAVLRGNAERFYRI